MYRDVIVNKQGGLRLRAAVSLFLALALSCCTGEEIMVADLVGTWAITPDSREYLPQSGSGSEARLVLKANGEFSASQFPGGLLRLEERPPLVNGGGTWKLLSDKPEQILLEFHMLTDARPGELPFGAQLFVSGGNSELFYYKGDPDEGIRIRFTQIR